MSQKIQRWNVFQGVPGKYLLEISAFREDDAVSQVPTSGGGAPYGVSVATLRKQFSGEEGTISGPEGETYRISLAQWANEDAEKTLLQMVFNFTPIYPVHADPSLVSPPPFALPTPPAPAGTPPPASSTAPLPEPAQETTPIPPATPTPEAPLRTHSSSTGSKRSGFSMMQDAHSGHKITIASTTDEKGSTISDLLSRPEIKQSELACPLCDAMMQTHGRMEEHIKRATQDFGEEGDKVHVIIWHPSSVPETRTPAENSFFGIQRFWRYTPVSTPPTPRLDDADLSVAVKSHDHVISIQPAESGTTAADLLRLSEVKQQDIACPVCETILQVSQPLEEAIRVFAEEAGTEEAFITCSIAHPDNIPETRPVPADSPVQVVRYNKTTDIQLEQDLSEGWPTFVLKAKG